MPGLVQVPLFCKNQAKCGHIFFVMGTLTYSKSLMGLVTSWKHLKTFLNWMFKLWLLKALQMFSARLSWSGSLLIWIMWASMKTRKSRLNQEFLPKKDLPDSLGEGATWLGNGENKFMLQVGPGCTELYCLEGIRKAVLADGPHRWRGWDPPGLQPIKV